MKKTNKLYLEQFLERIERIERIISETNREDFYSSYINQDALIYNLEVLGEISKRFSEYYKANVDEIPWHKIQGMRNRLIHDYDGIDLEIVWQAASEFVPSLKTIIEHQIKVIDTTKY
ncbi:MAG: hypothetical protein JWO32_198 [Bacteroidetes bacterium]|nr:hypothetical protein [Bacteroidota bacterium]